MYNSFKFKSTKVNKKNNLNTRTHTIHSNSSSIPSLIFNCQNMKSQQRKLINSILYRIILKSINNYNEIPKFKKSKIDLSNNSKQFLQLIQLCIGLSRFQIRISNYFILQQIQMLDAQSCRLINNDFILLRADTRDTDFIAFNGRGIIFHPRRVAACETVLLSVNRGIVITATMLSIKRNNPCYTLRRQP